MSEPIKSPRSHKKKEPIEVRKGGMASNEVVPDVALTGSMANPKVVKKAKPKPRTVTAKETKGVAGKPKTGPRVEDAKHEPLWVPVEPKARRTPVAKPHFVPLPKSVPPVPNPAPTPQRDYGATTGTLQEQWDAVSMAWHGMVNEIGEELQKIIDKLFKK